jgi:ribosome-binding factor A
MSKRLPALYRRVRPRDSVPAPVTPQRAKMTRRKNQQQHVHAARAPSQRQLRVGEELRHALAQMLRPGELHDPALREANVTVSEVRLSPDLRNATAFVMPLAGGNADEIMDGLQRSVAFLKGRVARELRLRRVPNLVFALDQAFDYAARIQTLLATPAVERDLKPSTDSSSGAAGDDDAG